MKAGSLLATVFTILLFQVSLSAQTCYTPITSWTGNYTLTGSGSGADLLNDGLTWTVTHSLAGSPSLPIFSVDCSTVAWQGFDVSTTTSVNDVATGKCSPPPGNFTVTYAGGPIFLTDATLAVSTSAKKFQFSDYVVLSGTATAVGCGGSDSEPTPIEMWPGDSTCTTDPTFTPSLVLPDTAQPLSAQTSFSGRALCPFGVSSNWNLNFTFVPTIQVDDDCKKDKGSSIGCQNQSLGEDVPLVGTGFNLHYESSRIAAAGGNITASNDALMIGGWTLSVHHAYDSVSNTLFLGDGRQRNGYQLGTPVTFSGNTLITSEDGSEVYEFDISTGRHIQTVRPMTGAVLYKFTYDGAGNLTKVTDAKGNVTTIKRNASEHPTAIVSPYSQTTNLKVDTNGFLSQVTDPLTNSQKFTNTGGGLITSRIDANGNTYKYTYDANGHVTKDADPVGGFTGLVRTNSTTGFGSTVAHTSAMGLTSSYQNAVQTPWIQSPTSAFSEQRTITWPNGLQATVNKTQHGTQRTESVSLPNAFSRSITLGPDPVWGLQAPLLRSSSLKQGNLTMNVTGSRSTTLGTAGNLFSVATMTDTQSINGRTYTSLFTGSTRTFLNTTPVGRTQTLILDTLERLSSDQTGTLTASKYAYDSRGRLASITQGTRKTTYAYDTHGFVAGITDPLLLTTSYTRDADGRLLIATLPDNRLINFSYDANGNLTSITPPGKTAHEFTYTAVDLPASYTPPVISGAGATTYEYDLDRKPTKLTRPDGQTIANAYDTAGQLISVTTPSGVISFTYNGTTGNLATAARAGEKIAYSYNGSLPTKSTWTGTVAGNVSRSYNNNFWTALQAVGGGTSIAMTYDNDGLLTKAGALTISRNANRLITGTTLGVATDTRAYNNFGELTGYTASINGSSAYKVQYTRDADGRVTAKTETLGATTTTYSYTYDAAGRLSAVTRNATTDSYTYDTNSNRLTATLGSSTSNGSYDAQDRLVTYGTASYTYTANGELATQKAGTQKTTYKYDVLGNLISVTLPNATKLAYTIDAENHRVGKSVNGALATGFLYDDDRLVAQLNGSNQLVGQFVYATTSNAPDYMIKGGVTYRIFSDPLGSPVLVVNSSTGAIAQQITYDEFGNVLTDSSPGFQPFAFAGGLYDQDTKLLRFGARDYDANRGRWTAKDPISFEGGAANLYGYVLNDPINWIDPSGLDGECPACDIKARESMKKVGKMWIKSKGGTDSDAIEKGIQDEVPKPNPLQEWKNQNDRSKQTAEESSWDLFKKLKDLWKTCTDAL